MDKFSDAQEALIDALYDEYMSYATVYTPPDEAMPKILPWLTVAYGLFDARVPARVELVPSPDAARELATQLCGEPVTALDWCDMGDAGWISRYDFGVRAGFLAADDPEWRQLVTLRDFGRVAFDTILLDECAIVVERPRSVCVDENGSLHSVTGPCVTWGDGRVGYAYRGTWVPRQVIEAPRSFTRDEYVAITNTEIRRAIGELAGWDFVADLLGARPVDSWTDERTGLEYVLLAAADGARFVRKQSPPLKGGGSPHYLEPVARELRTAQAARKWQATRLSVEECEADPTLRYEIES